MTLVDCERRGLCIKIKKGEPETKELYCFAYGGAAGVRCVWSGLCVKAGKEVHLGTEEVPSTNLQAEILWRKISKRKCL